MIDIKTIEKLATTLSEQLPAGLIALKDDTEKNLKTILQQQFSALDLVTREEFDTQSAVLAKTREKLERLEKTLNALSTGK
ncbi:MAG: accessory factor UbiK family protein [Cycloclasticus sp.]|nr:accessory factor UbiK family protein [Cycloclasticus sp.]MBQ0790110.1 accessory factor UbiK family protein [Cycloclasticus sp.]